MTAEASDNRPFQNGWFCPKCDKLTEHTQKQDGSTYGRQICNVCGFALGKSTGPEKDPLERKLKEKIYRLTRQVERQKSAPLLEKRLAEAKEELLKMQNKTNTAREMKFNRDRWQRMKSP
jgi:hypothetical protein